MKKPAKKLKHASGPHTPGPWVIETTEDSHFILSKDDSTQIAHLDAVGPQSFSMPNAHLIAAAPDMLAALKAVQIYLGGEMGTVESIVDQAIAKAEGGAE